MTQEVITYEQPINELVRACLRLEHLFKQLAFRTDNERSFDTQYTMQLLIEIIRVLDRPDLKSKFAQEIHRYISMFRKLEASPNIDQKALNQKLFELEQLLDYLSQVSGRLAQTLEGIDFLTAIRLNLTSAGNGCCTDMPTYQFWLSLDSSKQNAQFNKWSEHLAPINSTVMLLLNIVRGSCEPRIVTAENGFYHEALQTSPRCQLLRISVPKMLNLYPEISAGKHRFTIRFLQFTLERQIQTDKAINFSLSCCGL